MKPNTLTSFQNWIIGTTPAVLKNIHKQDVNVVIYDREIGNLKNEIDRCLKLNTELRLEGELEEIMDSLSDALDREVHSSLIKDIHELLMLFKDVSRTEKFRLLLATVNTNMCRKFHTDVNYIRMLCTYRGPGTLWLKDENINRDALGSRGYNHLIVKDESKIEQVETGSVVLLKGAKYPNEETKAAVHRSPTIEESSEKRLLLRIDTGDF